jgi:cell division protein FtsW
MVIIALGALNIIGYVAVIMAGELRGYLPSPLIAARDLLLFIPIIVVFFWLARRQRYQGDLTILTAALLLFTIGNIAQFRLFSDPEYGARGRKKYEARQAKMQTILKRNIDTAYDARKKAALYGNENGSPPAPDTSILERSLSISKLLTSEYTYLPILGLLGLAIGFVLIRRDDTLLLIQRYSFSIGIITLALFLGLVLLFSARGKFLGETTPWEPVKILFLFSFAGMLADNYRSLSQTRWGLPPARALLPFLAVAALPALPFFLLSDFGQMLVFFGVYGLLFFISVRKLPQLIYAFFFSALFVPIFYFGFGIPNRIKLRFHLWLNAWEAPAHDLSWWMPYFERIQKEYGRPITNLDAWFDQSSQMALGLFGIQAGGLRGQGLGLGFPEVVPVSDSDFIYAAIAEELGFLGGLVVILAFATLIFAGLRIAIEARDMYTKLIAAGICAFLGFQALVNLGGVLRVLPMTGITLPFVSHGGSSLVTSFVMLGILMGISHRNSEAGFANDQT